jgi:hypothetical protein
MQTFKFLIFHNDFCFDRGGADANCVTPSSHYRIPGRLLCPDRKFSHLLHLNRAVHRAIIGNYRIQKTESVERGGGAQYILAGNQPASQQSVTRVVSRVHDALSIFHCHVVAHWTANLCATASPAPHPGARGPTVSSRLHWQTRARAT